MYCVKLKNRGLIKITGPEARDFLQELITNDINLLDSQPNLYACLLTPQGKFLHDFFITSKDGTLLLDCEGGERARDLERRLRLYILRKDVTIACDESVDVFAIMGESHGTPDPRHPEMGYRSFKKPDLPEEPFETWDMHRITLTIPDGSRDLVPEKSTMDEGRMDQFNAIDYEKGCYVGQELTARMHYRGLGKKHLETVDVNNLPDKAELRSSCGNIGVALIKKIK